MISNEISVVIPAYQVTPYVAQALDSVLAQTEPPAEIIVINDGCPDTVRLEEAIAPYRGRVTYIKQPNGGPAAARNAGLRRARGDLIAFLDADDYWEPEFLAQQARYLREHPGVDLVYTDAIYFRDDGTTLGTLMQVAPSDGEATLQALVEGRCTVATTTVVARRSRLLAAGLFDEQIGNYSEDFDLWLRVVHSGGRIAYQRAPLVHHRVHDASLTAHPLQLPRGALRVLEKALRDLDLSPAERGAIEWRMAIINADLLAEDAKRLLLAGDYRTAHERMEASARLVPTRKRKLAALCIRWTPRLARHALQARRKPARRAHGGP